MQATLAAATRQTRGKNEARRLRRTGRLPAVVYGGAPVESLALDVDPKALLRILHSESGVNTLVDLQVDGSDSGKVLIKDIQHDPVTDTLLHVDLFRLAMDRALTVTVPVMLSGEAAGVKQQGGLLDFVTREFQVECMPTEIPEHVDVDVSDLMIGDGVRVRDVAEGRELDAGERPRHAARARDDAQDRHRRRRGGGDRGGGGRRRGRGRRRRRGGLGDCAMVQTPRQVPVGRPSEPGGDASAREPPCGPQAPRHGPRGREWRPGAFDSRPRQSGRAVPRDAPQRRLRRRSTSWPGASACASRARPPTRFWRGNGGPAPA